MTDKRKRTDSGAEPPPAEPAAPVAATRQWAVNSVDLLVVPNRGPVELSVRLSLSREQAEPLLAEATRNEEALRESVHKAVAASAEAKALSEATRRLDALLVRETDLEASLRDLTGELEAAQADELASLANKQAATDRELEACRVALRAARQRHEDSAKALARTAEQIAERERQAALAVAAEAERSAGGLIAVAAEQLGGLVTAAQLGSVLRAWGWAAIAAHRAATALAGQLPLSLPPLPIATAGDTPFGPLRGAGPSPSWPPPARPLPAARDGDGLPTVLTMPHHQKENRA